MTHNIKPVHRKKKKFTVWGKILTVVITFLFGFALQQNKAIAEIDTQKDVYLFLHGKTDLQEKVVDMLVEYGFSKEKIILATPEKVGNVGDYMAMLWKPPKPDHIKIQRITKIEEADPEKIIGLWKGVSREDIDAIPLEEVAW
ncbi:MAG: hypothetical protein MRJ65_04465 [Candidatus Brocadiaceae bacterium]|nr:hypothetical protein [Candidatus Brocadiaceae bacterium]